MEAIKPNEKKRIEKMNSLFKKLKADKQNEVIKLLQKKVDLEEARKLSASVKPNAMTLDEIVKETKASRSKVHAQSNNNT